MKVLPAWQRPPWEYQVIIPRLKARIVAVEKGIVAEVKGIVAVTPEGSPLDGLRPTAHKCGELLPIRQRPSWEQQEVIPRWKARIVAVEEIILTVVSPEGSPL